MDELGSIWIDRLITNDYIGLQMIELGTVAIRLKISTLKMYTHERRMSQAGLPNNAGNWLLMDEESA